MVSKINSIGLFGLDGYTVEIEADISNGLPSFDMVGLPDATVKESKERVKSSIRNSGFDFPVRKVTVNLAPADVRKEGSSFDLPVLLSILNASGQISFDFNDCIFIGELSLSGDIRAVNGVLPTIIFAKQKGFKKAFVPSVNSKEASILDDIEIYPVNHVTDIINHFNGSSPITPIKTDPKTLWEAPEDELFDFSDVCGQESAKRALEIAAAGLHNVLLIGPPGSGKSMLSKRLPTILPEMSMDEAIETTKIHSIAGALSNNRPLITTRPFRNPHHTISLAGLSGGGRVAHPGEISLANNGVLFLDELPEFPKSVLEVLRQPLENGSIVISRVSGTVSYPCNIMLVCAMNPCRCGYFGHPTKSCICSQASIANYLSRISGPLLDRLDIHIEVPPVKFEELNSKQKGESSKAIRERVNKARQIQLNRYKGTNITANSRLTPSMIKKFCKLSDENIRFMKSAFDKLNLSARSYDKILKISRTIADLDGSEDILPMHIAEAVQFRSLDRKYFNL